MKFRSWIIALVAILSLGALLLFAGTRIVFRWVLTGIPMPTIKRVLIVGLTDNYLVRQEFEDKMEELLVKSGGDGDRRVRHAACFPECAGGVRPPGVHS
jgi:hypothetical protein